MKYRPEGSGKVTNLRMAGSDEYFFVACVQCSRSNLRIATIVIHASADDEQTCNITSFDGNIIIINNEKYVTVDECKQQ